MRRPRNRARVIFPTHDLEQLAQIRVNPSIQVLSNNKLKLRVHHSNQGAWMTLEAMTFAADPNAEIRDHALTDEYAAALAALERGEPEARSRVLAAYEHLCARCTDRDLRT